MIQRLLACLLFASCFVTAALGQSASSVGGTVTDPSGALVIGSTITLTNTDNSAIRTDHTDKQGHYNISQVPPGNYTLTATFQGFGETKVEKIQLLVNTSSTVDVMLKASGQNETVEVTAGAAQVNLTDATLGNVITTTPIVQLPLEGRNVTGLLALQPGVTFIKEPPVGGQTDRRSGSVNGGKADQANVLLDGVDANDQQNRSSFTSVLRVTPDSIQEFRTITSNPGAELGHSSGAQVTLITKGGTNTFHGTLYEYNRNTALEANSFLGKQAGTARPALIRNVYGVSVGGPIKQDKLFLFLNYEGRRDASASQQQRIVPTSDFRQGIFTYANTAKGTSKLTPAQVNAKDPQGIGENPIVLADLQKYPQPNLSTLGDGYNTSGYLFNAKTPLRYNTYIGRLDYHIDTAGRHSVFFRGNMQTDNFANGAPQFPGQPPSSVYVNFSKGYAFGYNWIATNNLVNSLRFGFTRQSVGTTGTQTASTSYFYGITPLYPMGAASSTQAGGTATNQQLPIYDIRDDVTWSKGRHTIGFGGEIMLLKNHYNSNANSFSNAYMDGLYLVNNGGDFVVPDAQKTTPYEVQFSNLFGLEAKLQRRQVYDQQGNTLPDGTMVHRIFDEKHFDLYVQDSWKALPNLTITGGIRYSAGPPIFETQGYNVNSTNSLSDWFNKRGALAASGVSQVGAGTVSYNLGSALNKPLYGFQNNVSPRVSFAFSPKGENGFLHMLSGGADKMSIRGGMGMFYDVFGEGLERDFSNAVGFSVLSQNSGGQQVANVPRYTGFYNVPFTSSLMPAPVAGGFPQTPITGGFAQASTIDSNIQSPYSLAENLTVSREFKGGFLVQASWVGRQSRHSLIGEDIGAPTNLYDAGSGMDYFAAARVLSDYARNGVTAANVPRVAYWENLWPGAATATTSATQGVYAQFVANKNDWTSALLNLDEKCTPSCSKLGQYAMWSQQFAALYTFKSIGMGDYNGLQVLVRKAMSKGFQFDFNYTYSKCIDLGSSVETSGSGGTGSINNSWNPSQMRAACDYDLRHQITAFGIAQLPFGKGRLFGGNVNRFVDTFIGGWQLTTIFRTTSGLPGSVANGVGFPTVWNTTGYATQIAPLPKKGPKGQIFADPAAGFAAFSPTYAGQSGSRNVIRGDGLITLDGGVDKRFHLWEVKGQEHSLQFRFEGFNLTNTARFDATTANLTLSSSKNFGIYSGSQLIDPRAFQAALRYEF